MSRSVKINEQAYNGIAQIQEVMKRMVGFTPSITQVIESLVAKEVEDIERSKNDKPS